MGCGAGFLGLCAVECGYSVCGLFCRFLQFVGCRAGLFFCGL